MTTGESSSANPNPNDYWAQPERAGQAQHLLGLLQQYAGGFVTSLEPVADSFVAQEDVIPTGWVELNPPRNYKQYGLETPALAVHLVLDAQIKGRTGDERFLGIVRATNFENYELQGRSMTVACGKQADQRSPGEYAPVALAMPAGYYGSYHAQWLARLPVEVIEEQAAATATARLARNRMELLRSRAAAAELRARKNLFDKIMVTVIGRTDPAKIEGWNRTGEVSDEALVMRALDTQGQDTNRGNARNLAEVRQRAASGLLPSWEGLFVAAAVVMSDDEMREL